MIKSVHIVGIRGDKGLKGHKIKAIEQMTNTWIKFRGRGDDPRIIKITSCSSLKYFADKFVMQAKTLIMKSLLEFLADPSSERRLVYEMGLAAAGTFKIHKVDDAVQEICHQTEKFVWMKLLELPHNEMYSNRNVSTFGSFLLIDNLQRELTSKTSCCIEVYGLNDEPSMLCTPYVFIHGMDAGEVNDVAVKVACLIEQHPQKNHVGLQSQNDNADVDSSRVLKKIFIPTDFDYKALIIGPNGKKHQELVALCGGGMNIQIKIRGGDSNSMRSGSTKEPVHVILDGTKASVDKAEKLIMELLDTEKARFLDTLANRKRKSLLGTDSLSEHSIEYPRKSCKVMGKTITLTIPLWVMKAGNDLNGKYMTFLILMTIA
jgi:hypothetical protein